MKRLFIMSLLMFLFLMNASFSCAVPKKRFDPGAKMCRILTFYNSGWISDGSQIFKETCKSCHYKGNDKGAPFLHTESKNSQGWNRVFYKKYPKCAKDGSWGILTLENQMQLNDFLYRNAADTYDPYDEESCG